MTAAKPIDLSLLPAEMREGRLLEYFRARNVAAKTAGSRALVTSEDLNRRFGYTWLGTTLRLRREQRLTCVDAEDGSEVGWVLADSFSSGVQNIPHVPNQKKVRRRGRVVDVFKAAQAVCAKFDGEGVIDLDQLQEHVERLKGALERVTGRNEYKQAMAENAIPTTIAEAGIFEPATGPLIATATPAPPPEELEVKWSVDYVDPNDPNEE